MKTIYKVLSISAIALIMCIIIGLSIYFNRLFCFSDSEMATIILLDVVLFGICGYGMMTVID